MRYYLILLCFSVFSNYSFGQISMDFPSNPEPGKCYERCFYYDKPIQWVEVDCNKIKTKKSKKYSIFDSPENISIFIEYQEKLIALGYKLKATGILDTKTIHAHNKYLKTKAKEKRRQKRKLRKNSKQKNR